METKSGRRPRRQLTDRSKDGAVVLVLDQSKPIPEVARDLDLTESLRRGWVERDIHGLVREGAHVKFAWIKHRRRRGDLLGAIAARRSIVRCSGPFVVAGVLAAICACKSPSPWARSIPAEERAAWPTLCGIPANEISKAADGPKDNYEGSMYQLTPKQLVSCRLSWNREEGRLESLSVQFADSGVVRLSNEQIAPYLTLVLKELQPPERREIEVIATGSMRNFTRVGRFDVRGGHGTDPALWSLYVAVH